MFVHTRSMTFLCFISTLNVGGRVCVMWSVPVCGRVCEVRPAGLFITCEWLHSVSVTLYAARSSVSHRALYVFVCLFVGDGGASRTTIITSITMQGLAQQLQHPHDKQPWKLTKEDSYVMVSGFSFGNSMSSQEKWLFLLTLVTQLPEGP